MPGSLSRQEETRGAGERRRSGQGASRAPRQPDEEKRILSQFRARPPGDGGRARDGFPNGYVGARRQNPQPRGEAQVREPARVLFGPGPLGTSPGAIEVLALQRRK